MDIDKVGTIALIDQSRTAARLFWENHHPDDPLPVRVIEIDEDDPEFPYRIQCLDEDCDVWVRGHVLSPITALPWLLYLSV